MCLSKVFRNRKFQQRMQTTPKHRSCDSVGVGPGLQPSRRWLCPAASFSAHYQGTVEAHQTVVTYLRKDLVLLSFY